MRSIQRVLFGTFLASTLALSAPAFAQKGGAPKTDTAGKKADADKKAAADKEKADAEKAEAEKADAAKKAELEKGVGDAKAADGDPIPVEPPAEKWDNSNVEELPGKSYFFVGLRYRGNVVPGFLLNMFVDEGKTIYTNMIGVEFDLRKDGFSLIPAISYHELGTGDILFKQKNTPDIVGNYSLVNSGLKLVYAQVDLLWSTKVHKNIDFEYGLGVGLGAVFGDLENSWVREGAGGLKGSNGKEYIRCDQVGDPGTGCNKADHQNSDVNKVGGYKEESWFSGGSKPALFPWISVPQIGLRFKPVKQFVGRLGIGFGLTGFWFGLSGQYGLEKKPN